MSKLNTLLHHSPFGFAYHQLIVNEVGQPTDILFLEVNAAYEQLTGLTAAQLIGHKYTEVIPCTADMMAQFATWLQLYARIALHQTDSDNPNSDSYEQYSAPLDRWFHIHLFSDAPGCFAAFITDITPQKKAEEKLHQSETRYRALFEQATDGIVLTDMAGNFLMYNERAASIFGYTPEEVKHMTYLDGSAERAQSQESFARIWAGEHLPTYERRFYAKNGEVVVTELTATLVRGETGQPLCAQIVLRDITKRKKIEEQLRLQADMLRSVGQAVIATDLAGEVIYLNSAAEALYGWSMAEAMGKPITSVTVQADNINHALEIMQKLQTGQSWSGAFPVRRRDGTTFLAQVTNTPLYDQQGERIGVVGVSEDITARELAAEKLHLQSAALAAADNAIVITSVKGIIQWVNPAYTRLTGYTLTEVLGETPSIMRSGKQPKAFYRELWRTIARGRVWRGQLVNKRKDGSLYTEEMTITPVRNDAGKITHFIAIKEDITERLAQEKEKRRSQRLESIGQLAGGVAHDLNNALAPIVLALDVLRLRFPERMKDIEVVAASTKRAGEMVRHLLAFARGKEGERVAVEMDEVVREVEAMMRGSFPKSIGVVVQLGGGTVSGDATQLHQVLLNLCVNARDAMPQGGVLRVNTRVVVLREGSLPTAVGNPAQPGHYVHLQVQDSGHGISPDVQERMFEPFFTTKSIDQGTGLGLSTVLGIVQGYDGFIHVSSQLDEGTTFNVYLPRTEAVAPVNESPRQALAAAKLLPYRKGTILVVDDEQGIREIMGLVLPRLQYEPLLTASGLEGLGQARAHSAKLKGVIVDVHMPQMDGLTFVRALRQFLPDVPVLVATGYMDETTAVAFTDIPHTACLNKPFTEAELRQALENLSP